MYNIEVAREIYKRLLENGVNISLAGIPIVEEVLNEEDERRRTQHALDVATVSPIERDWAGEVEDNAWAYLQDPPRK
jgi:hypothetical protein